MAHPLHPPLFDGHNDVLSKIVAAAPGDPVAEFSTNNGAIDLARARAGGFAGGLFAIWVNSPGAGGPDYGAMAQARFDVPLPAPVPQTTALTSAVAQASLLFRLEDAGCLAVCRSVPDIEAAMGAGRLAAVLHMEGAEAIDRDLAALDLFHAAGLRSLGPVWSRPNRFGHGVPFRFPGSPDTGPGLTEDGVRLVKRCDALNIMVDMSHLTEAGFWDVARVSTRPLVATHSNVHALCAATRNLTDRQLAAIAETGGMVGLNFASAFLREDGRMLSGTPLSDVLRHLDGLLARLGEDHVGFGSDYDGAVVPEAVAGVERLPALRQALAAHGYDASLVEKLCYKNWLRVLGAVWSA